MGRTLKRVPLDFDWPLKEIWHGYLNDLPHPSCPDCEGRGYSPEALALFDKWYGKDRPQLHWGPRWYAWCYNLDKDDIQALIDEDRLYEFTRVPITEEQKEIVRQRKSEGQSSWLPFSNGYIPTPEEVNGWSRNSLGHDSLNAHIVVKAKTARLGLPFLCATCQGEGCVWDSPEDQKAYEEWEPLEPPTGDGYQLWETTTEGSPASPVFETLDALCEWCEEHATTFADYTASAFKWKKMLQEDFVSHTEGNMTFI
jgi:hypothetical protein